MRVRRAVRVGLLCRVERSVALLYTLYKIYSDMGTNEVERGKWRPRTTVS